MFRKLTALALIATGIAAVVKKRGQAGSASDAGSTAAPSPAPSSGETPEQVSDQGSEPAVDRASTQADDLAEVRSGQTEDTIESPVVGPDGDEAVIPDVSDEDPLVRQQESAAAAEAGSVGGAADSATADTDPEMRPVYEGSGGDPETFETTDEQGR